MLVIWFFIANFYRGEIDEFHDLLKRPFCFKVDKKRMDIKGIPIRSTPSLMLYNFFTKVYTFVDLIMSIFEHQVEYDDWDCFITFELCACILILIF